MRKLFCFIAMALSATIVVPAFGAVSIGKFYSMLPGKYEVEFEDGITAEFVITKNLRIRLLDETREVNHVSMSVDSRNSSDDFTIDGLPVVHFVITTASDEDSREYHLFVSIEQDQKRYKLRKITAFSTFNDGPGGSSSIVSSEVAGLLKWDESKKRYEPIL